MIISTFQKLCLFLLSLCSLRVAHGLADFLSIFIFSERSKKYRVAYKNLKICFPDKTEYWIKKTAKESLKEYMKSLLESPHLYKVSKKNINILIKKIYNENIIKDCLDQNKGVIFMTPHHGSWELSGLFVASKIKTFNMFKPLRNKVLNDFVLKGRMSKGATLVETDNTGVKKLLKALKNNYGIGVLPDHTPKINQGVMSNFFDVPANTSSLIYKLGKKNKVPIIYIFSERLPNSAGFNLHLGFIEEMFYDLDEKSSADFLNKKIEHLVNINIPQYLWSYERFRNRSGVLENIYNS